MHESSFYPVASGVIPVVRVGENTLGVIRADPSRQPEIIHTIARPSDLRATRAPKRLRLFRRAFSVS